MNKFKIISIFFCLLFFFILCRNCYSETSSEWILRKFNIELPFKINTKNIIEENREWFIAIKLTHAQTQEIFKNDFEKDGFLGWGKNTLNRSICSKKNFFINKENKNMWVNYRKGANPPWNYIAMYLDKKENILILYWGITFGC